MHSSLRYLGDPVAFAPVLPVWTQEAAPGPVLPTGVRALFARLAARRMAPEAPGGAREPLAAPAAEQDDADHCADYGACPDRALRARAHAAYRCVDGRADRALDMALGVMEAEIDRLRAAVEEYGEALKSIEVYGQDAAARLIATTALRAAPCALRAAPPVPRDPGRGPGRDDG